MSSAEFPEVVFDKLQEGQGKYMSSKASLRVGVARRVRRRVGRRSLTRAHSFEVDQSRMARLIN